MREYLLIQGVDWKSDILVAHLKTEIEEIIDNSKVIVDAFFEVDFFLQTFNTTFYFVLVKRSIET